MPAARIFLQLIADFVVYLGLLIRMPMENKAVREHLLSIRRQMSQSILDRLKRGQHEGDVPKAAPIVPTGYRRSM